MINRSALLKDLQGELPKIELDILAYSESREDLTAHLQEEYEKAREAGRTAEHFVAWREAQITQSAVAWILSCVFVRFLEDNSLLAEPILAGPVENAQGEKRLAHAKERMVAYFNENPTHEERDYLFSQFEQLEKIPVIAELLDHRHNPLWLIPVSADGANRLIDFFQKIDAESGEIVHDFTDVEWDTRFLGDLYQDLSEAVRKRYALLQTPEFVESFILDNTLEKAKDTFGLPGLRLIDPTCGSGHFLLTTFERVFEDWVKREPATNSRVLAQRALDVVHGVDINPYAIAICRFRLLIAAMKAAGTYKVKDAPDFHFNLACGDSLLHGRRFEWQGQGLQTDLIDEDPVKHVLEVEDKDKLLRILGQQYHVVVGNPPYITVKDSAVRESIRHRYFTCSGKYSLGVPFTERFFELTGVFANGKAGYMGMITANSFIKRDFGKKLVESYLPRKDITNLIDVSGFDFAGHGTPTIIIFARNQSPVSPEITTVIGSVADSKSSDAIQNGEAWIDIVSNFCTPGFCGKYIQTESKKREVFSKHPWSLVSGDNAVMLSILDVNTPNKLEGVCESIGPATFPGLDDTFLWPAGVLKRIIGDDRTTRKFVYGESVRNWGVESNIEALVPYDSDFEVLIPRKTDNWFRVLWAYRVNLENLIGFGGRKRKDTGAPWWEWYRWIKGRLEVRLSIAFPFVSTHNHFVLDRGGKVFKQTAPVIKLPKGTSEADHLVLLGLLNSAVACFWGRQVFFPKGGFADGKWEERLEWDGTKLKRFPIPSALDDDVQDDSRLLPGFQIVENLAKQIDSLAQSLAEQLPALVLEKLGDGNLVEHLNKAKLKSANLRSQMIALQEELDWQCYQTYGLLDEAIVYDGELPLVQAGERTFEIRLARDLVDNGGSNAWFTRHDLIQTTEIPSHWPEDYRVLIENRLTIMQSERFIKLIEKPEYKRRWLPLEWDKQEQMALQNWLLRFLEQQFFDASQPALISCAKLADSLNKNTLAKVVAQRYAGNELFEAQPLIEQLVASEHIPQMAAVRFKPTSMKKFFAWQETWDKQRQEDTIDAEFGVDQPIAEKDAEEPEKLAAYEKEKQKATAKKAQTVGDIPVPPKYALSDFRKPSYWPLRGKLDVPKERFFSLPGCEKDGDATLVIGWAGMNHLQRAQAIASWYLGRKEGEGWEADRLTPMLVAIDELIPWLKQWHNDIDPEYGERMGDYYEGFLLEELRQLNISRDDLLSWEPPITVKKKRTAKIEKVTAV